MTDEQKMLMQLIGYDSDMHLMNYIAEMRLKMEELKKDYYQDTSEKIKRVNRDLIVTIMMKESNVIRTNPTILLQLFGKILIK